MRSLKILLGDYPHTKPIKAGKLNVGSCLLQFPVIRPVHDGFAPMVRDLFFDISELAIVTVLQAIERDVPLVILPAILTSRFQRDRIIALAGGSFTEPASLIGQRVGVRAYTQTTGMWARAALWEDHGIAADTIRWRTRDGAHVDNYKEPPFVEPDRSGRSLPEQLRAGDVAAAIMGSDLPEDLDFVRVLADHELADQRALAQHGFIPPNHLLVATKAVIEREPDVVRVIYQQLRSAAEAEAETTCEPRPTRFGLDEVRAPIAYAIQEAFRQKLITHPLDVDAMLAPAAKLLGPR